MLEVVKRKKFKIFTFTLPEVGEELRFEQQISDVSYADIPNYLLLWSLYNWKATYFIISHPPESFKNQFIALDANNLFNDKEVY